MQEYIHTSSRRSTRYACLHKSCWCRLGEYNLKGSPVGCSVLSLLRVCHPPTSGPLYMIIPGGNPIASTGWMSSCEPRTCPGPKVHYGIGSSHVAFLTVGHGSHSHWGPWGWWHWSSDTWGWWLSHTEKGSSRFEPSVVWYKQVFANQDTQCFPCSGHQVCSLGPVIVVCWGAWLGLELYKLIFKPSHRTFQRYFDMWLLWWLKLKILQKSTCSLIYGSSHQ